MKQIQFKKLIILPFAILLFSACDSSKVKTLGEGNSDGASTGKAESQALFYVKVKKSATSSNPDEEYLTHTLEGGIGVDSDWTKACEIKKSDIANSTVDIMCIVEAPELDLYVSGVNIQFNVPGNMCDHFRFQPYSYFKFDPVGVVSLTGSAGACGEAPACASDYSADQGPNCCVGTWSDDAGCADPISGDYQGNIGNCLSGPGASGDYLETTYTKPLAHYWDLTVNDDGILDSLDIEGPIKKDMVSNVYIANYYNPADHAAMANTTNAWADLGTKAPASYDLYTDHRNIRYRPNPYYTFDCLDRYQDIKARIRLMIRDWDTKTVAQGGTHDSTGVEDDFDQDDKNDRWDWKDWQDWENLGGGRISFPSFSE